MIDKQDEFKEDRRQTKTLEQIKEYARRYSIRLDGLTDQQILDRWNAKPVWD